MIKNDKKQERTTKWNQTKNEEMCCYYYVLCQREAFEFCFVELFFLFVWGVLHYLSWCLSCEETRNESKGEREKTKENREKKKNSITFPHRCLASFFFHPFLPFALFTLLSLHPASRIAFISPSLSSIYFPPFLFSISLADFSIRPLIRIVPSSQHPSLPLPVLPPQRV